MTKRIVAIAFIFICSTIAWAILGSTIFARTYNSDLGLKNKVTSNWGGPQTQSPPTSCYPEEVTRTVDTTENGKTVSKEVKQWECFNLPLESSNIDVKFAMDYRQKGLLWYSTYNVDFAGAYAFRNNTPKDRGVDVTLKLPAAQAIYDDLQVTLNGQPIPSNVAGDSVHASGNVPAGQPAVFKIAYRSHGLDKWNYSFGSGDVSQVKDFHLHMKTDFGDFDFPENTLSPTSKRELALSGDTKAASGWELNWDYTNLVSGFQVGVEMPQKLQPGPLAGRISLFAPVSLFFFFFLMFIITTTRGIELHPMNYFFLATAFFAFHLLLAYLVDHMSIHAAFLVCSAVSIFLVVTYLRLVVGGRFALVEAGISQFIYLVLFSYAFFFQGFTGLAVTIGAIVTLFVVMQMTGRIRWAEKFAGASAPLPTRT
jgi:inner membrane protein involved in colicin E2 resistance